MAKQKWIVGYDGEDFSEETFYLQKDGSYTEDRETAKLFTDRSKAFKACEEDGWIVPQKF